MIRISALSMLLFTLILIALGRQPPADPLPIFALSDPACKLPCWFGIHPGVTTRGEMEARLARYPDLFSSLQYINIFPSGFTQCWTVKRDDWRVCIGEGREPNRPIPFLRFMPPRGTVTLGSVIQHFGRPTYTFGCLAGASSEHSFRGMNVQFGEIMLVAADNASRSGVALMPQMSVQAITVGPVPRYGQPAMRGLPNDQQWHGFGLRSIYPTLCSFP
jgi:hypothetical protein